MDSPGVAVERTFRAPRALVWALLSDTNRYDRALGLSLPRYSWREHQGVRQLVGAAKQSGLAVSWIERPYQWVEGRFFEGGRDFLTGPALEGGLRIEVQDAPEGCHARVTAFGAARSWALRLASPLLELALRRRLTAYMDDVARLVQDEALAAGLHDEYGEMPPASRVHAMLLQGDSGVVGGAAGVVDSVELDRRRRGLESSPVDPEVARRIVAFVSTQPDEEVAQIRPFELARTWHLDRRAVLRGFLYATKAGLVDLNWQINCPVCRVSAAVVGSLADVGRDVHCESCNIQYAIAFGDNVEAVFRCSAALRAVESTVYCASSPTFRPHVLAQLRVQAAATRTEAMFPWCGHLAVRTLAAHSPASLHQESAPARLEVCITPDRVQMTATGTADNGAGTQLVLRSECDESVDVVLERAGWSADAVLGSVVASMAEFIDLFATEAPAAGLELSIGRLTLLFSDLTGSTALYTEIGDARAFAVVQEHFAILDAAITAHGGAIVKTMGDAVMATFAALPAAVAAAVEAVKQTRLRHGDLAIGVKVGVHEGPCLAVRANERLDFFGTTVNVAARLQGQADTGELVLQAEVAERPDVAELLVDCPRRAFTAGLKGIDVAQRLVAFDLDGSATPAA